jgi:hypothetical protein
LPIWDVGANRKPQCPSWHDVQDLMMVAATRTFSDPAAAAAQLLFGLALVLLMIVTPVAEVFLHGPLYVLLPVGACILIVAGRVAQARGDRPNFSAILRSPITWAAVFIFFWAGLSIIWTPFQDEAATRFFKALGTAVVAFLAIISLPSKTRPSNLYFLPIGLAIAACATIALTFIEPRMFFQGDHPDATLAQRSVMSLMVLLWPALGALALREKWFLAIGLAAIVTAAALATYIQIALVGLALAAVVYAIAVSEAQRVGQILGFGLAALMVLAPAAALVTFAVTNAAHMAPSGPGFVFAELLQREWPRFITGHGLGFVTSAIAGGVLPPDVPRSILFEIWFELGLLGALAFAVLAVYVFNAAARMPDFVAPSLLAGLVAGLVVAVWGAETTQIWWISLNGLDAIALALTCKALPRATRRSVALAENERADTDRDARFEDDNFSD